jgi:hypothetical protein
MHALLDADIFLYEMGSALDDEGNPLAWNLVQARLDARINQILDAVQAETWQGYITGKGNFRDGLSTIKDYKGNRDRSARPFWHQAVHQYLVQDRAVAVCHGIEADDQIAMDHGEGTIICSRDKDLKQVPGWHYSWPSWKQEEQHPYYINETDALRFFYKQLLTGDPTDNILGLYGVGAKAACVQRIDTYSTELDMFSEVKEQYELRFGKYWPMFMEENGALLYLLRHPEDSWNAQMSRMRQSTGT